MKLPVFCCLLLDLFSDVYLIKKHEKIHGWIDDLFDLFFFTFKHYHIQRPAHQPTETAAPQI